ncbi:TonB-dependent receptor plug domain-containing protein [Thalassotalea crassostreae]|uniref:TonB-dependent receptor plug domain-containing protein n=1 Tax=Thalassotalea crassostreae TaxID=1763536 RepID=UPI0008380239|nr:TonB-dependent receptor [Thalassotalea crassostreae]
MYSNNKLAKAVRLALVFGATATAGISANAIAAEEETAAEDVERIEVTGSRIKRTDMETPVPVTVIGRADMLEMGALNVADVLNQSPVAIASSDQSNSAFTTSSVGLNTTALRNLGQSRTLVLVNGRRFVSGVSPSVGYAVDLNAIPTSMIERIEILKSASSAIYGSDAVAGVVNIITRNNLEGIEVNAQSGISSESDREKYTLNITAGNSWDTGSVTVAIGYDEDKGLKSSDRSFSDTDQAIFLDENGNEVVGDLYSSYPPQGRVSWFDPATGTGANYNGDGTAFDTRFNRAAYRQLVTPIERKYAALNIKQEVTDSVEYFAEVNWNSSKTNDSTIEPTPFDAIGDVYLPSRGGTVGLTIDNPMVPQLLRDNLINDGFAPDAALPGLVRRMLEFGPRATDVERSTIRIATGVDWELNDSWMLNSYVSWGQTDQIQENGGQVNVERTAKAFDVVADGMGGLKCADDLAVLQGCVPLNLFGEGTITQDAIDYVGVPAKVTGKAEQFVFSLSAVGELGLELPGGNIGVAVGYEHRLEKGTHNPGDLAQTGASSTNRSAATDGSFYTNDYFAEVVLPVLDTVEVDLAARYSDHEVVGGQTTWNAGVQFTPFESFMVRASAATAIRTPNVADLYGGRGETFRTVTDPCNGLQADGTGVANADIAANCLSIPEIATRVAGAGEFALTQVETQSTGGTIGGSATVKEETADTFSAGFVWQVTDGLSMTVDYYDITVEDAIATTSRSTVLSRCFDVAPGEFDASCTDASGQIGAIRDANGALTDVNSGTSNENDYETSGIDLEVSYSVEFGPGTFTADVIWNHTNEYVITSIESGESTDYVGEVLTPDDRANFNLGYALDDWSFAWRMRYWSESEDSVTGNNYNFTNFAPLEKFNTFDAVVYHDIAATWYFMENANVTFNARNILDEEPPVANQSSWNGGTGINTVSEAYDVTGPYYQASLTFKF